jgi:hypothetical protein
MLSSGGNAVKPLYAVILVLGVTLFAVGQSVDDLRAKYPPEEDYQVRPGIWMTPSYDAEGQVCEMVLERRHAIITATETSVNYDSTLSPQTVKELVDELAPFSVRGREDRAAGTWAESIINGGSAVTKYPYENVTVEVHGALPILDREEFLREFRASQKPGVHSASHDSTPGIQDVVVFIRWNKRTCSPEAASRSACAKPMNGKPQPGPLMTERK